MEQYNYCYYIKFGLGFKAKMYLVKEDQEKANKFDLFKDLSKSEKLNLYKILKAKGLKMKPQIDNIPSNYASKIYLDENNLLHFPILIIYEEFSFTDYINSIISYYEISEQDKKDYCRYYPLRNDDKLMNTLLWINIRDNFRSPFELLIRLINKIIIYPLGQ